MWVHAVTDLEFLYGGGDIEDWKVNRVEFGEMVCFLLRSTRGSRERCELPAASGHGAPPQPQTHFGEFKS
jgi:hypothetical protein